MKIKYFILPLVAATAAFFSSCNNGNENAEPIDNKDATLKIVLKGVSETSGVRSTVTPTDESTIKHFTVYVFNAENDALEDVVNVPSGTNVATISGLSTGFDKKVVVTANTPSTYPKFIPGDEYSKFTQTTSALNLTYQNPASIATNGMIMFGETESPVEMQMTGTTKVEIEMKRLAAKVRLGSVTVIPTEDWEIEDFEVTGVSIQRAVATCDIFGNTINPSLMFAGLTGSYNSTIQPFLYDALSPTFQVGQGQNFDNYFYVFPNPSRENCTLLTLVSTYNGDEQYFPIKINSNVGEQTDGMLVESNKVYVINITVNNLGEGTDDPDVPPTTATMEVEVSVAPWDLEIQQDVIW